MKARSHTDRSHGLGGSTHYYYAAGRRVPLRQNRDLVAMPAHALSRLGLSAEAITSLQSTARAIAPNMILLDLSSLSPATRARVHSHPEANAVFSRRNETIVVLPEIAVAASDSVALRDAHKLLEQKSTNIVTKRPDEFVAHLSSNDSRATLALATHLFESYHLDMAQPRFIRIVLSPRPTQ